MLNWPITPLPRSRSAALLFALFGLWFFSCHKDSFPVSTTPTSLGNTAADDRDACCPTVVPPSFPDGNCPVVRAQLYDFIYNKGLTQCSYAVNPSNQSTNKCVTWSYQKVTDAAHPDYNTYHVNFNLSGSPSTQLREALGCGTGTQAHHIVPIQLCTSFSGVSSSIHIIVEKGGRDGFHPNDAYNGYCVPTANHTGSHPAYTQWVKNELDFYKSQKPSATNRQANKFLQCRLIPRLRTHITNAITAGKNVQTYFTGLPQDNLGP